MQKRTKKINKWVVLFFTLFFLSILIPIRLLADVYIGTSNTPVDTDKKEAQALDTATNHEKDDIIAGFKISVKQDSSSIGDFMSLIQGNATTYSVYYDINMDGSKEIFTQFNAKITSSGNGNYRFTGYDMVTQNISSRLIKSSNLPKLKALLDAQGFTTSPESSNLYTKVNKVLAAMDKSTRTTAGEAALNELLNYLGLDNTKDSVIVIEPLFYADGKNLSTGATAGYTLLTTTMYYNAYLNYMTATNQKVNGNKPSTYTNKAKTVAELVDARHGILWIERAVDPIARNIYPGNFTGTSGYGGVAIQTNEPSIPKKTIVEIYYCDIDGGTSSCKSMGVDSLNVKLSTENLGTSLDVESVFKKVSGYKNLDGWTSGDVTYVNYGYKVKNALGTLDKTKSKAQSEAHTFFNVKTLAKAKQGQIVKEDTTTIYYYYKATHKPVTVTINYVSADGKTTVKTKETEKIEYGETFTFTNTRNKVINSYSRIGWAKGSNTPSSMSQTFPIKITNLKNDLTIYIYYEKIVTVNFRYSAIDATKSKDAGDAVRVKTGYGYGTKRVYDATRSDIIYAWKTNPTGILHTIPSNGSFTTLSDYFYNFIAQEDKNNDASPMYEMYYAGFVRINDETSKKITLAAGAKLTPSSYVNVSTLQSTNTLYIYFKHVMARRVGYYIIDKTKDITTQETKFYTTNAYQKVTANRYIVTGSNDSITSYINGTIAQKLGLIADNYVVDFAQASSTYKNKRLYIGDYYKAKSSGDDLYVFINDAKTKPKYTTDKTGKDVLVKPVATRITSDDSAITRTKYFTTSSKAVYISLHFQALNGRDDITPTPTITVVTPTVCRETMTASMRVTSNWNNTMNYMDFYNGASVYTSFSFDGSYNNNCVSNVTTTIEGDIGDYSFTYNGSSITKAVSTDEILGTAPNNLYVSALGGFTADSGALTKYASATAKSYVTLTNIAPVASFSYSTEACGSTLTNTLNGNLLGYIGLPVTAVNTSYDYEDDIYYSLWTIKKDGVLVGSVYDSDYITTAPSYNSSVLFNAEERNGTLLFTPKVSGIYELTLTVVDNSGMSNSKSTTTKYVTVGAEVSNPVSYINGLNSSFEGIPISLSSGATDANDDINYWSWSIRKINDDNSRSWTSTLRNTTGLGNNSLAKGTVTFTEKGYYIVSLTVQDLTYGCTKADTYQKIIKAVGCTVITDISGPSTVKENRKASFTSANSIVPDYAQIDDSRATYIITPLDGQDVSNIKIDDNYGNTVTYSGNSVISTGSRNIDTLFKTTGQYQVKVILHNSCTDDLRTKLSASDIAAIENGTGASLSGSVSDYYDELLDTSNMTIPTDYDDLQASVRTTTITVYSDEVPYVNIFTQNANPNFIDNPTFINLTMTAETNSPDSDIVRKYEWVLKKDKNEDGTYSSSEVTNSVTGYNNVQSGANTTSITLPIYFDQGIDGKYEATLKVTEEFGQETIDKFVTSSDRRTNSISKTFLVDWVPSISFTTNDYYYVDDTVTATVTIKDEKPSEDKAIVVYTIYKLNPNTNQYEQIQYTKRNASTGVWETTYVKTSVDYAQTHIESTSGSIYTYQVVDGFKNPTGTMTQNYISMKFPSSGNYRIVAKVTDAVGQTSSITQNFRVYDLPTAVVTDFEAYRYDYSGLKPLFQAKQNRRYDLTGATSYTSDLFGDNTTSNGGINHNKDYFVITPLDGQNVSSIKMKDGTTGTVINSSNSIRFEVSNNNLDSDQFLFKESGRYQIDYQVTNYAGKKSALTATSRRVITVLEDLSPSVSFSLNEKFYKGAAGEETILSISEFYIRSNDGDITTVNNQSYVRFYLTYDSNNDGSYNDETRTLVSVKKVSEIEGTVDIRVSKLGKYRMEAEVVEGYGQETISEFVNLNYLSPVTSNTDRKYAYYVAYTELDNVAPSATFGVSTKSKVDVVFASGNNEQSSEFENNMTSFENVLNRASNNIDAVVEKVETERVDISTAFNWQEDISSSIGTIAITNNGQNISMTGNQSLAGKNALYIIPSGNANQTFTFDYSINFGDSFNGAGMLLKCTEENGYLKGYMLSFNNYNWKRVAGGASAAIWEFQYKLGTNTVPFTYTTSASSIGSTDSWMLLKQTLYINTSGSLTVSAIGNTITVEGGGMALPVNYEIETNYGSGFGFFSDHYSHNCNQIGGFVLENINLQTTNSKTLADSLTNVSWRNDTNRFVVWVEDDVPTELKWAKLLSEATGTTSIYTRQMTSSYNSGVTQIYYTEKIPQSSASITRYTDYFRLTSSGDSGFVIRNTNAGIGSSGATYGNFNAIRVNFTKNSTTKTADLYWASTSTGFTPENGVKSTIDSTGVTFYLEGTTFNSSNSTYLRFDLNGDNIVGTNTFDVTSIEFLYINTPDMIKQTTEYQTSYASYLQTLALLQSSNINLILLGGSENMQFAKDYIFPNIIVTNEPIVLSKNNMYDGGIWYDNGMLVGNGVDGSRTDGGNIISAMSDASSYIIELMKQNKKTSMYVLVGEEVIYDITYSDSNGDPSYLMTSLNRNIETEKWYYSHRENFYKNSLGTIDDDKTWKVGPYTTFTKTGLYKVNLKMRDNPINFDSNGQTLSSQTTTLYDSEGNPVTTDGQKTMYRMADGSTLSYWWGTGAITNIVNHKTAVTTPYDNSLSHSFSEYRYWSTDYDSTNDSCGGTTTISVNGETREITLACSESTSTDSATTSTTTATTTTTTATYSAAIDSSKLSSTSTAAVLSNLDDTDSDDSLYVVPDSTLNYVVGVPTQTLSRVVLSETVGDSAQTTSSSDYVSNPTVVNGTAGDIFVVYPLKNDIINNDDLYSSISNVISSTNCTVVLNGDAMTVYTDSSKSGTGIATITYELTVTNMDTQNVEYILTSTVTFNLVEKTSTNVGDVVYQAVDDTVHATAGDTVRVYPLANDIYDDTAIYPMIWSVDSTSNCTVTVEDDELIIFTDEDVYGDDSAYVIISILAYDGTDVGTTYQSKISLNLDKKNFQPIANADVYLIDEDEISIFEVLSNDYTKYNDLNIISVSTPKIAGTFELTNDDESSLGEVVMGYLFVPYTTAKNSGKVEINNDNTLTFTPDTNFNSYLTAESQYISFDYTIQEDDGDTSTSTVYVIIEAVNDVAEAVDDTFESEEDIETYFDILANDILGDGDVTITLGDYDTTVGTLTIENNQIHYVPALDYNGTFTFTYSMVDCFGNDAPTTATVTVTVLPVKDMPTLMADTATTTEDEYVDIYVLRNDLLGEALSISIHSITSINGGTAVIKTDSNGEQFVRFTPTANLNGTDVAGFTYSVSDNDGDITTGGSCTISITAVNDAPVAVNDTASTSEETSLTIPISTLLANDYDVDMDCNLNHPTSDSIKLVNVTGNDCTTKLIRNDSVVTVTMSNNVKIDGTNIIYTPVENFNGQDYFYYTIEDSYGVQSTAKVTVNVAAVNDAPIAYADTYTTVMNSNSIILDVTLNDLDVDGDTLVIKDVQQQNGVNVINSSIQVFRDSDGRYKIKYTPEEDFDGTDKLIYRVFDGKTYSEYVTCKIIVKIPGDTECDNMARIYVHRKPLSSFTTSVTKVNDAVTAISITGEDSYDLDHEGHLDSSASDNHLDRSNCVKSVEGIRAWEWTIQVLDDGTIYRKEFDMASYTDASAARTASINWVNSTLNSYINGSAVRGYYSYTIKLRVRDIDGFKALGQWSDYYTQLITPNPLKPIAYFNLSSADIELETESLGIIDGSYDPNGDEIKSWTYTLTDKDGTVIDSKTVYNKASIASVATQFTTTLRNRHANGANYSSTENTTYTISLVVVENTALALESDAYNVTFNVYPTNTTPSISISGFVHVYYEADSSDPDGRTANTIGDYWGDPEFNTIFNVWDAESSKDSATQNKGFTVSWKFENQLVTNIADYNDSVSPYKTFSYENTYNTPSISSSQRQEPFTGTVSSQDMTVGAYKVTVTVTDNVSTPPYKSSSNLSSSQSTYSYKSPYHMYIIPKVEVKALEYYHPATGIWNQDKYDSRNTFAVDYEEDDLKVMPGDIITVYATTGSYSTQTVLYYQNPTTGAYVAADMTLDSEDSAGKHWTVDLMIEETIEDVETLNIYVETRTNYGGYGSHSMTNNVINDGAYYNRRKISTFTIKILPVKLFDFAITYVTDNTITFGSPQYVADLAYDESNNSEGVLMKKGYAFDFELKSKGLKNNDDYVRIIPSFYGYNSLTGKYDKKLDMYYLNSDNNYVLSSTTDQANDLSVYWRGNDGILLGTLGQLNLPTSLRTAYSSSIQLWKGRYVIPGTAQFVPTGTALTKNSRYTGKVLITFDIEAMKSGSAKYNYVGKNQWTKERVDSNGNYINLLKTAYQDGAVILIDGVNSISDDYEARPVWKK